MFLFLGAALVCRCAEGATATIEYCLKVDTNNVQGVELRVLGELLMNVELLEAEKPTQMDNEFENVEVDSDGQIVIRNARFNTRVRASNQVSNVFISLCSVALSVLTTRT